MEDDATVGETTAEDWSTDKTGLDEEAKVDGTTEGATEEDLTSEDGSNGTEELAIIDAEEAETEGTECR